jgi:hypothetical protein
VRAEADQGPEAESRPRSVQGNRDDVDAGRAEPLSRAVSAFREDDRHRDAPPLQLSCEKERLIVWPAVNGIMDDEKDIHSATCIWDHQGSRRIRGLQVSGCCLAAENELLGRLPRRAFDGVAMT